MKRSKMLKHIKSTFRANHQLVLRYGGGDLSFGKMAELLSEDILNHIEEAGMLPPPSYVNPISLDYNRGFLGEIAYKYPQDGNGQFPFWEPEE